MIVRVCIARYNEDIEWANNLKYPYTIISKEGIPQDTGINKGNEASSYLQFIIDNYNNLPNYTAFVHGHRTSHHIKGNTDDVINNLVFDKDYFNFADAPVYRLSDFPNSYYFFKDSVSELNNILNKNIDPDKIIYKTSGTFYVKRESILKHSKQVYERLLEFLYNHKLNSFHTGRIFEYIYHIMFTGELVDHSF